MLRSTWEQGRVLLALVDPGRDDSLIFALIVALGILVGGFVILTLVARRRS